MSPPALRSLDLSFPPVGLVQDAVFPLPFLASFVSCEDALIYLAMGLGTVRRDSDSHPRH